MFKRSLNDSSCSVGGSCTLEIGNVNITLEITFGNGGEHLWILASCLLVQWQEIFFSPSVESCYVAYHLQGTTMFPLLQGF